MFKYFMIIFLFFILFAGCENKNHGTFETDEESFDDSVDIEESLEIYDINIAPNEKNLLSCRLTFKTRIKTAVSVKYYSEDHSGYEITGKKTDDHYFFLWGMRPESKYTIEIYSEEDSETPLEVSEYTSGALPDTVPYMNLTVNEREKVSDGFVLFTYYIVPIEQSEPIAMMIDPDGFVVWYFEYYMAGFNVIGDLQYIEETSTILMSLEKGPNMEDIPAEEAVEIDIEGNVLWKSREIANVYSDEHSWQHTYQRLDDDTILMLRYNYIDPIVTDYIINVDRDYNILWSWTYPDVFDLPECESDLCDWTHANGLNMFKEEGVVYINSRNLSQYLKIDMATGNVVWEFGKDGDFTMISDHPDPWIEYAHAPEIEPLKRNEVMFYDNGSEERGYSRIIKYRLNEEDMTAEIIFEFDGSKIGRKWFTMFWGDVETVNNGNIFITAGDFEAGEETRLFEITEEGEIVWEMLLNPPQQETLINALYNSHKFTPDLKKNGL